MKKSLALFSLLFTVTFFVACSDETLTFDVEKYAQVSDLPCQETCTEIRIEVAVASGGVVADSINQKVFENIKNTVYFGEMPLDANEYEDITNSFIKAYDDMKTEFPEDLMMPWEAEVFATIHHQTSELVQVNIDYYTFTGGAHGMSAQQALSFDPKTGKSLKTDDFFKDLKGIKKLAEQKFRTMFKIADQLSLADAGFMFQDDDFVLPENVFFSDKGITFHYNVYEIASYAQGAIELEFMYDEVDSFLKIR